MTTAQKISGYSYILYLLIILIPTKIEAQVNYVLNPSFEQYSRCPYNFDQIKFAYYWEPIDTVARHGIDTFGNGNCTPELCNTCATNSKASVPYNQNFYHYPRTGNSLVQEVMYTDSTNPNPYLRDYLQGTLSKPLSQGTSYCVTFFVSLERVGAYAVNHIGAYLDDGIIDTTLNCGLPQTTHIPQVQTLNIIDDLLNWVKIEGSFIANGTEKYITIGNFYDNAHTALIIANPTSIGVLESLYVVDDVSVVESNIPAYAGGDKFKAKQDSVFIGRNEIIPDCEWYRNGVLIDTVHAGFWVKDTATTTYIVKQSICGNVKYDTAVIKIANVGVTSVGSESIYKIYPNPAQHEITIQAPNNSNTATMWLYDMSGRIMLQKEVRFMGGECRVPLSLSSGVYFVEIVDKDGGKNIQRLSVL